MSDTPVLSFDSLFTDPFNETVASIFTAPSYLPVKIGEKSFIIDLKKYRRTTLPAKRDPVDQSHEPGEQSLNTTGLWTRSQWDWRLGSGQKYLDLGSGNLFSTTVGNDRTSSRRQYYQSEGLDPWVEREMSLLNGTQKILTFASTANQGLAVAGYLYVVDGSNVKYTSDPEDASPTWHTIAVGAAVTSICTDGTSIYMAYTSGIKKAAVNSTSASTFGAFAATGIFYVGGRLLATLANRIVELDSSGALVAHSLDFSQISTGFNWNGAIGTPGGIYAWGNTPDSGIAYFIDVDTDNGALKPPVFVDELDKGETLNDMTFYNGAMLFGTSIGFRVAAVDPNTPALQHGPFVTIIGGVNGFDGEGQYVYYTHNGSSNDAGIGRIDLSVFTDTLVPAYANDLSAHVDGTVDSVATVGGKRYFVIDNVGVYGQTDDLEETGYFETGKIIFGTVVPKVPAEMDYRCEELPDGATIRIEIKTDDLDWTQIELLTRSSATRPIAPLDLMFDATEEVDLRFTFTRGTDTTTSPIMKRWTFSALAAPPRTDEIIVPLIVAQIVDVPGEQPYIMDPLDTFIYLKQLENSAEIVPYIEGNRQSFPVYVDTVEVQPDKWDDELDFFDGQLVVRLLTVHPVT